MSNCLQYYYEKEEDAEKYRINCKNREYTNLNSIQDFKNKELLQFINEEYSSDAFPEDSPFEFQEDYIKLTNSEICNSTEMSLAPQQKFMGYLMGPSSNFNNMLIYHGLGSGKSCTSIVIGEALKNETNQRMIYAVPAPLVDQYYEEIAGEIRNGKFFSCPSFCLIKKEGNYERDFYVSQNNNTLLKSKLKKLDAKSNKLLDIQTQIDLEPNNQILVKEFKNQENEVNTLKRDLLNYQRKIRGEIIRTFEIVSHQTFIESLYKTSKSGNPIKNTRLMQDSALFQENGLLIIDEIQRLVSESGMFYKKLYNSIKYYFHPKLKIALLSATPVYDNPYELALTINLLRPRVPFPLDKSEFYKIFIGEINEDGKCVPKEDNKTWINENSCVINKDLMSYLCSGYVSYFKGGNPNAYPYKRVISLEHVFSEEHKTKYISALKSDMSRDPNFKKDETRDVGFYENLLLGNYENDNEDQISGIYVTTQQYSNIFLPEIAGSINKTVSEKKNALSVFKNSLMSNKFSDNNQIIEYVKRYSTKFASIIDLSLNSNGPVFIFSNWLIYGVEPLAIILEACGLVSFEKQDKGFGKYFIWSSETKIKDRDGTLIKKARNTFNSLENKDGSLLKIILGTRSVMEGVSFKNVKQVHITEPWWNESRIEQILARASRYCSHSALSYEDQFVDIYRHYSVYPGSNDDADALQMMKEIGKPKGWKNYERLGIDQIMLSSSIKKYYINTEINNVLKQCSVDVNINKNGNIMRLEEYVIPSQNGYYQIYYKNPSNGRMYIRDGIPDDISFEDIYNRSYSYPKEDLPIKFTEANVNDEGKFVAYEDPEILTEENVNKDLNFKEEIIPWNSDKTFESLEIDKNVKNIFVNLYNKYRLLPVLRKVYFENRNDKASLAILTACVNKMIKDSNVDPETRKKLSEKFKKLSVKSKINQKVLDIIYKYKLYPESALDDLIDIALTDEQAINDILKTVSKK